MDDRSQVFETHEAMAFYSSRGVNYLSSESEKDDTRIRGDLATQIVPMTDNF